MNLYITYVTHKDAILDVKVQVPCNGLLRSNFSEKEEETWIKFGEDYNFIQLGDWVYLALLYDLWSTIHWKQIDFYLIICDLFGFNRGRGRNWNVIGKLSSTVFFSSQQTLGFLISCFFLLAMVPFHCAFCQMWIVPWSSRETSGFCKRNGRLNCCEL